MQDKHEVFLALSEIAALLTISGEQRFKVRAYETGADIVQGLGDDLGKLVEEERLTGIEGIGPALASQIKELWTTGQSRMLEKLRSQHPPGAAELVRLEGMTPKRLHALHEALGIASVEELRAACESGKVRAVRGFGSKTEQKLLASAIRFREQAEDRRILLVDGLALAARLIAHLEKSGAVTRVELTGAARRAEETLRELELTVEGEPARVYESLARVPAVVRIERDEARARLAAGVPLNLHFATPQTYAATLVRSTGSPAHVAALAKLARERGLSFDERGMPASHGELGALCDERDVYRAVGLAYVPPELRTGQGELLLAESRGFDELVSESDVRGAVHCHTVYSDGKATIEEMARAAEALGLEYITITDHSASAHYAHGVTLDRLKEQWDEIARVQELVKVRILRGTESDILGDGTLDYPDDVLERFDVIIASIHARLRMDRAQMTERLVRAMELPVFKIWGHALGRLLLNRDPIDCDLERVLDAIARSRAAIEVNGDPYRLDLPPAFIPEARARGIPFVLSVDAHSTRGLGVLPFAVRMARRGGLQRSEVLNTLSADQFASAVAPRP